MRRRLEDGGDRRILDDAAGVHDANAVCVLGDDAKIVADQHHGHRAVAADLLQELEDLRLDGGVERRRRLIGYEDLRLASAMAIITRWFMPPDSSCG